MSVIVSDTSPIRALHFIGKVELLRDQFGHVLVPPAVVLELSNARLGTGPIDVTGWPFIEIATPASSARVRELSRELDRGEAEAIALAEQFENATLLIDEAAGRAIAAATGLAHVGVLGVLARAKVDRQVPLLRPLLDQLRTGLRFRISDHLYRRFLEVNGEG
jgi:predicted nucleic acid-binding protein